MPTNNYKTRLPLFSLFTTFHLLSLLISPTNSSHILYEIDNLIRVYDDGTVVRLSGTEFVPPSYDPKTRVLSKDIHIPIHTGSNLTIISARLFMPEQDGGIVLSSKLPLLVYFHGGGFVTDSPFSPGYHNYLNSVAAEANVVVVSVKYRLAPENHLPIAYRDSWLALKWVLSHSGSSGTEAWLNDYVDFSRVYLGGDSAGGNIAHNVAMRAGLEGMEVQGMFLICPHFWGSKRIGSEAGHPEDVAWAESIWIHAYPDSIGFDDPALNPAMDPNLGKLGCKNVLVYVAEYDILRDRGFYYGESLKRSDWEGRIRVVEEKGEIHDFNLVYPDNPKAVKMLTELAMFLNTKQVMKRGMRVRRYAYGLSSALI